MNKCGLVCIAVLAFGALLAQAAFSASYAELDAFFSAAYSDANLASHLIPSVSVAVVYRNGTIAYERAFGWQNKATSTPATPNTIYRLASVSKTFAGTVAMQLVQEGKASLDADLNTYFQQVNPPVKYAYELVGNVSNYADLPRVPDATPLTLRNAMVQNLGLDAEANMGTCYTYQTCVSLAEFYATSLVPRVRPANQAITYSNMGVGLIGLVAEAADRDSWGNILQNRLLTPLQLNNTYPFITAAMLASPHRQVYQTMTAAGGIQNAEVPTLQEFNMYPAGAMWGSAHDMAAYCAMHLNNGTYAPTGVQILQPNTTQQMHQQQFTSDPRLPGLGFIWFQGNINGTSFIEHDGNLPGFNNRLRLWLNEGVALVQLSNSDATAGFPYIATLADTFQNVFIDGFNCTRDVPGGILTTTVGCLAPASRLPGVLPPQANAASLYAPMLGPTVGYRFARTTWQKLGGYFQNVRTLSVYNGWLIQAADGFCYPQLSNGAFYQGFLVPLPSGTGYDCYAAYPFSDTWLNVATFDPSGRMYYFLSQSGLNEPAPAGFTLSWFGVIGAWIAFFFLFFLAFVPAAPCVLFCQCCRCPRGSDAYSQDAKSTQAGGGLTPVSPGVTTKMNPLRTLSPARNADVSVSGSVSVNVNTVSDSCSESTPAPGEPRWLTFAALAATGAACISNLVNVLGAVLSLQSQVFVGQYAPVRAIMRAAIAAVVFDVPAVVLTAWVRVRARWPLPLWLVLVLFQLVNVAYIFISLQWNWFGPWFVLG